MIGVALPQADLSTVPDATLELLRDAIATERLRTPVTRVGLLDQGVRHQLDAIETTLSGHSALACLSVLDVVLAERRTNRRPVPELVWTGPERSNSTARDTAIVLRALFERARQQVILAGYDFTQGSSLLQPLWIAMRDRQVDVRCFVHIQQVEQTLPDASAYANQQVRDLMAAIWPFGAPWPHVYYDTRVLKPKPWFNMHAKCVVVDGECALVTSANFTRRAHEQNTECGVLLEDRSFAHHLSRQWLGLIEGGFMREAVSMRT
jgi:phosphatidylserine/phosphatidylglycerophosphate/cardiolipin synthase-like enzyme